MQKEIISDEKQLSFKRKGLQNLQKTYNEALETSARFSKALNQAEPSFLK
jgi:hypothetical protein